MSNDQVGNKITFKCTYCGNPITVTYSQFRFTEICPACRGSVMIPRPKPNEGLAGAAPFAGPTLKESGDWPAAHYAQPGARVIDIPAPSSASIPAPKQEAAQTACTTQATQGTSGTPLPGGISPVGVAPVGAPPTPG